MFDEVAFARRLKNVQHPKEPLLYPITEEQWIGLEELQKPLSKEFLRYLKEGVWIPRKINSNSEQT